MGYLTILLKDDGVQTTFSMFKMGYELFSNCAKLSSALVPRIQNDRSLMRVAQCCIDNYTNKVLMISSSDCTTNRAL